MAFITDPDDLTQATEVVITTGTKEIQLLAAGNLNDAGSTAADNGVTLQCLYSFLKEEWKSDATLIPHPFPMLAISAKAGEFEFIEGWKLKDATSRNFIRRGGWSEVDADGNITAQYAGFRSLGTFEDPTDDQPYYAFGTDATDIAAAVDTDFPGYVDQSIKVFEELGNPVDFEFDSANSMIRTAGSFITDGYQVGGQVTIRNADTAGNNSTRTISAVAALTLTVSGGTSYTVEGDTNAILAVDNRNKIQFFLRVRDGDAKGKVFSKADVLTDLGASALSNQLFGFGLANSSDQKIDETDANVSTQSPYTEIGIKYFDQAFSREVDSATPRNFGIVIDVGTHSGVDGSSAGTAVFTTTEGGITGADYIGGTLIIHEGTDKGTHTISGTPTATTVTVSVALSGTESNLSFTLQRATAVVASTQEIYEKVQYQLRQGSDIDDTTGTVSGDTADELLTFVGDALFCGKTTPTNPNGGGSGVIIEGFDANDTNDLTFYDNTGTNYTYPFVAAGTLNFSSNLVTDTDSLYWLFYAYTERFTNAGFSTTASSGATATLNSSVTDLTAELTSGDFIRISGHADANNNGIWELTGAPTGIGPWTAAMTKVDGATVSDEAPASSSVDKNPIDSPDAIIVDSNAGTDIQGSITTSPITFDFDYDNNVQGGRTADTEAVVLLIAIGLQLGQYVRSDEFTISKTTGLSFSVTSTFERNYENAA